MGRIRHEDGKSGMYTSMGEGIGCIPSGQFITRGGVEVLVWMFTSRRVKRKTCSDRIVGEQCLSNPTFGRKCKLAFLCGTKCFDV